MAAPEVAQKSETVPAVSRRHNIPDTVRDGYEFVGLVSDNGYTIVEERPSDIAPDWWVVLGINYGRSNDRYVVWHAEKTRSGKRVNFSNGIYATSPAYAATLFMRR